MQNSIIDIQNLSVGYKRGRHITLVQTGISIQLSPGKLTCLLGANGTGKSTLLRTLCGFQPLLDGRVLVNGESLEAIPPERLSQLIGVVLTERLSIFNATVREIVGYGRSPFTGFFGTLGKKDRQRVDQALKITGIDHKKEHLIQNLSDGERQKVMIAKALVQDTPVIILDEPTAFLDLPARVEIMQLLRQLASNTGKAILMSTHDLDLALQVADQMWVMQKEEPLIFGSPEDLVLQNAFQRVFEGSGIIFDNRTGLFRVKSSYNYSVGVDGHGFEYVLLRRALARCGVRTEKPGDHHLVIHIIQGNPGCFSLTDEDEEVFKSGSVEAIVGEVCRLKKEKTPQVI